MATDPTLGTRIKRARERKRWTQRQLADALQVNIKTVDNWENARTSPRNSIGAIEEVLGVSLDEELTDPEPPPELNLPPAFVDEVRRMFPGAEDQQRMYEFIRLVRSGRLPRHEAGTPGERQSRSASRAG